ncbi:MAG: two-component system, cell cycle response regulator [Clostridiales bacterium]|jgi:DNA-binding response OmpR family regulator|nr:two-component system, cell cycle response regulator [Clostridiales bacterium]MDN5300428.1 two-component system, cell cycle response regulator [Clostridiales bacterium]
MNILHFEYSDFFKRFVKDLVDNAGHTYIHTNRGEMLFNLLAHYDIDLIITGMELSDMTGEQLIQSLRTSKFKHIPIVIITSATVENINKRLRGVKFDDVILKENLTFDSFTKCIDRIEDDLAR